MTYGKNLTWFLSQIAVAESDQFETGSIEIYGENEQGQEGSTEVEIADIALAAQKRIEELEKLLIASAEREEGMLVAIDGLQSPSLLMSKENPRGMTLESLLAKVQEEIEIKNSKVINDKSDLSLYVQENNKTILWHLDNAQKLQEDSYRELSKKAADHGVMGKPRIG